MRAEPVPIAILAVPLRSAWLGGFVVASALILGVPLFLRMPPWCDLTLYDVGARTVIGGGTMYKDVFDTNLPGFVWCLIGIRRAFGTSLEAVRAVDLLVAIAIAILLMRFVRRCGADRASQAWLAACIALFYPFTTEFSHAQRDVWMTLPMFAAVMLRLRHLERNNINVFSASFSEGALWGVAIWFKPHVLIVAIAIWLLTLRGNKTDLKKDFRGYLVGGLAIGFMGIAALVLTGTWKHLVEVFTKWNSKYLLTVWGETLPMLERFPHMFGRWSLLHLAGIPLAIRAFLRRHRDENHFRRGTLATFYLMMLSQSCLLQRNFDYVHIPEMLLLFAVLSVEAPRLPALACLLGILLTASDRTNINNYLQSWPACFAGLDPVANRVRQKSLAREPEYFSSIDPVQIGEVADWLKSQDVQPGEVLAWHDSPHAVYLELGHKPPFRFMHITTTLISDDNFWRASRELRKALPGVKYIVSDIYHPLRFGHGPAEEAGPDMLPPVFPPRLRQSFPWDQPAAFRSGNGQGRYIVHRLTQPIEKFEFEWNVWETEASRPEK